MRLPQDRILHIDTEVKDGKVNITAEWQGEIVRCCECKKQFTSKCYMIYGKNMMRNLFDNDFCSYGERRE